MSKESLSRILIGILLLISGVKPNPGPEDNTASLPSTTSTTSTFVDGRSTLVAIIMLTVVVMFTMVLMCVCVSRFVRMKRVGEQRRFRKSNSIEECSVLLGQQEQIILAPLSDETKEVSEERRLGEINSTEQTFTENLPLMRPEVQIEVEYEDYGIKRVSKDRRLTERNSIEEPFTENLPPTRPEQNEVECIDYENEAFGTHCRENKYDLSDSSYDSLKTEIHAHQDAPNDSVSELQHQRGAAHQDNKEITIATIIEVKRVSKERRPTERNSIEEPFTENLPPTRPEQNEVECIDYENEAFGTHCRENKYDLSNSSFDLLKTEIHAHQDAPNDSVSELQHQRGAAHQDNKEITINTIIEVKMVSKERRLTERNSIEEPFTENLPPTRPEQNEVECIDYESKLEKCIPLQSHNVHSKADLSNLEGSDTFSEKETFTNGKSVETQSRRDYLREDLRQGSSIDSLKTEIQTHQDAPNDSVSELKHQRGAAHQDSKESIIITIVDDVQRKIKKDPETKRMQANSVCMLHTTDGVQRKRKGDPKSKRFHNTGYHRVNTEVHPIAFIALFSKICYKHCFLDQIDKTFGGLVHCSRLTIERSIKQCVTNIVKTKLNYKTYDILFTLCLLLVKKNRLHSPMFNRLMMFVPTIVPRTSAPSLALCIYNSVKVKKLRQNRNFDEALCLVLNNIKCIDLDAVCTFNCQRILDLVKVLREQFLITNNSQLLHVMLEFTQLGFIQLGNDRSSLAGKLKETLSEHTRFYLIKKTLCLKDYGSSKERLVKAILSVDRPACQLAIQNGADFNWCIQALFQVIRSNPSIVYVENDDAEPTFLNHQISIINYLIFLDVHEYIIEQGLSFFRLPGDGRRIAILNGICSKLEKTHDRLCTKSFPLKVKYGRIVENHTEKEVFVAFVDTNKNMENQTFAGRDVLFRNPLRINHEGIKVALSSSFKDHPLSDNDFVKIRETISREGKWLWEKHTNLNIISACSVRSKQNGQTIIAQPCIVLYCTCKGFIPNSEQKFPKSLQSKNGSIEVDVREGFFSLGCGRKTTDWNSPLRMGGSVGLSGRKTAGTVGPFVKLSQGRTGFLTCAHVFAALAQLQQNTNHNIINVNMNTVQPSDADFPSVPRGETRVCGMIKQLMWNNSLPTGIDAALVEITHRHPERGLFAINSEIELRNAGFTKETDPIFDTGAIIRTISADDRRRTVVKFGYKTGLTIGSFLLDGAEVLIKEQPFECGSSLPIVFKGMYEIRCDINNAFRLGDSGSGVFLIDKDEKMHCVGIAIGCTSYGSTIVEPIGPVLDVLSGSSSQLSLKQFSFPEMNEG